MVRDPGLRWVLAAAVIGWLAPWLARPLDRWLYDALMAARPRQALPQDFLLVDVTAPRSATLDKQSLAYLIDRLSTAGARVIVVDMLFPAVIGAQKALDAFYAAVARSPCVVWASQLTREGGTITGHRPPIEALHPSELGFAEFLEDADRVVRRALLYVRVSGRGTYTSLATSAWLLWCHSAVPGFPSPAEFRAALASDAPVQLPIANDDGRIFIDTAWVSRDETGRGPGIVKLADLVAVTPGSDTRSDTNLLASLPLRGRVVFLAQIAPAEGGDIFTVPGAGPGNTREVPGFLIHAGILASLITGRGLRPMSVVMSTVVALVLSLVGGLLARMGRFPGGAGGELALAVLVIAGSGTALAVAGVVLPSVGFGLALAGGAQAARRIGLPARSVTVGEHGMAGATAPGTPPPIAIAPAVPEASGVGLGETTTSPHIVGSPMTRDASLSTRNTLVPKPLAVTEGAVTMAPGVSVDRTGHAVSAQESVVRQATGGRYIDLRPLAEGGMGSLYIGRDVRLGRPVVIKFLTAALKARGGIIAERFAREVALLVKLEGAGLPLVLDRQVEGAEPFVVMERIEGETLSEHLERAGPYALDEALRLADEMAAMMVQVHGHGVIHRDLKLNNLMVDATGRLRLLDLGLAHSEEEMPGLTQTGQIMGTLGYMAPEQERGDPVDKRADVYAFGVMLYEMLSGVLPLGQRHKILVDFQAYPPPLCLLRPDVPLEVVELVMRCLAPRAEDRPASFGVLQRAMARYRVPASGGGDAELWMVIQELARACADDASSPHGDTSAAAADLLARARSLDPVLMTDGARWKRVTSRLGEMLVRARTAGRSSFTLMHKRMDRIAMHGSVQVAVRVREAWSPGRHQAPLEVDDAARAMVWGTAFPATVTALLQCIVRQLSTSDPEPLPRGASARLTVTGDGHAHAPALQVTASATYPILAPVLERWKAQLLPALDWLGGRLEAMEPARIAVRLPLGFIRPSVPQARTRV